MNELTDADKRRAKAAASLIEGNAWKMLNFMKLLKVELECGLIDGAQVKAALALGEAHGALNGVKILCDSLGIMRDTAVRGPEGDSE